MLKQKKIIIVDDDTTLCDTLAENFRKNGAIVYVANDAKAGFQTILKEKPDVAVLDIMMPYESGLDLVSDIRRTKEGADTFCIILTNSLRSEHVAEAMEKNVQIFLQKSSVEPSSVWNIIEEHFREKGI